MRNRKQAFREELAWQLAGHLRGLGDVCAIIWSHFGFSDGIGRMVDTSGWAHFDRLCLSVWDPVEDGGLDWRNAPASALASAVTDARLRNQPEDWDDETSVPMSEEGRSAVVAYLDELMVLVKRAAPMLRWSEYLRVAPQTQMKIWAEVRDRLAVFGVTA